MTQNPNPLIKIWRLISQTNLIDLFKVSNQEDVFWNGFKRSWATAFAFFWISLLALYLLSATGLRKDAYLCPLIFFLGLILGPWWWKWSFTQIRGYFMGLLGLFLTIIAILLLLGGACMALIAVTKV